MFSFHRIIAFITLVVSFALLSHARPTHHARGLQVRADATEFIAKMKAFQAEVGSCSEDLNKVAVTGENPQVQVKKIVSTFDNMSVYLGKASVKLTPEQEKECAGIFADILVKATEASHKVATKASLMKWYSLWTEQDVAMHACLLKLCSILFSVAQLAIKTAGQSICSELHDMKMRLMVNLFRGMGVGY